MEERLEDNPFLKLSSSLYYADNERDAAKLADMEDFFAYRGILYKCQHLNTSPSHHLNTSTPQHLNIT